MRPKSAKKRKASELENATVPAEPEPDVPLTRSSDEAPVKKSRWTNKTRVLIFSSRGISYRDRHLMKDLRMMMPHAKSDTKMDRKDQLPVINEICEMKNCSKCLYFESKKKQDLYLWMASSPDGPSAKFLVENVHTMHELKMTGNCLKGSRPLVSFDDSFESEPQYKLLKELFTQIFSTPNHHPKSQPFFDHVFTFSIADNRIWFRNFQILRENGELAEIGPRMVLNPMRIFKGSFGGVTLYQNPNFKSPNELRRQMKMAHGNKYNNKIASKKSFGEKMDAAKGKTYRVDATDDVFRTDIADEEA